MTKTFKLSKQSSPQLHQVFLIFIMLYLLLMIILWRMGGEGLRESTGEFELMTSYIRAIPQPLQTYATVGLISKIYPPLSLSLSLSLFECFTFPPRLEFPHKHPPPHSHTHTH